ncbi:molybdate ABC transporter substrate-binding protein [Hyphomicrobium sp. LHD-15]|uniref:molybdate ABC transporter substrate-binding protein n=1 Tax=Hyphomicrobium sp. LHD-15 TaxID=3072142 RepID=UPI00280FAD6F|nr:molybdate ABC transporter substrate-binding protein [Hyphomicrobium sp. LHD-15]MDQ8700684.1 molybdate ABC transporter substrate-binding protein [Hyphomicrobium sp. LHD-15]
MTKLARTFASFFAMAFLAIPLANAQDARPAENAAVATKPVVVFAAASLKNALDTIAKDWEAKTGKKATLSFAASSAIAKQIESGAPADLFISADLKWMDWVAERKLIDDASRKTLLGNTLVLIAPAESTVNLKIEKGFKLAEALGEGRLAMGDPKSVPAGIYGQAALTSLGVWDQVSAKVAGAENVRVALTYVARGETPLGVVYGTDAKSEPKVKVVDIFPADSHQPIVYPVAITASSTNADAKAFLAYLSTPEAAKVFEGQGFTVLK